MADEKPRGVAPFPGKGKRGADYDAGWETLWQDGIARFDMAGPHKGLMDVFQRGVVTVRDKSVLAPGCGRGYDAIALAEAGGRVEGLEISETAVRAAEAYLKQHNANAATPVAVRYTTVDFFKHEGVYDVGYDDTFFCALHPDLRQPWGEKWSELLSADGTLIVVVFPIVPQKKDGPPWHMDREMVTQYLQQNFELVFAEKVSSELSAPRRVGLEDIMIWKKK